MLYVHRSERADQLVGGLGGLLAGPPADPLAREAAVAALGAIGHPDGLPAILAATSDKPAIRRRAVLANRKATRATTIARA